MKLVKSDYLNLSFIIFCILISIPSIAVTFTIRADKYPEGGRIEIHESDSIKIDFTGFVINETGSAKPDKLVIHIQNNGRSDYYSVPYTKDKSVYESNSTTLNPHISPPFPGFVKDFYIYIIIGNETSEGSLDKGIFRDMWTLHINVE